MRTPHLRTTWAPRHPKGVVVVLHGGAARQDRPMVSPAQLSVLRMVPIAARLAVSGRGRLAVFRLLNSTRGWDTRHTPVDDARWALREVSRRYPGVPCALVGHSLGGRAALLAGAAEEVTSVVALNPWVSPDDRADLTGRHVLIVHGTDDRVASLARAEAFADSLTRTAESFSFLRVRDGRHAMLRRGTVFTRAAADFVSATMLGRPAGGVVGRLLAGETDALV